MVAAPVHAGLFEGNEVSRLLDHQDASMLTPRVGTQLTGIGVGEVPADATVPDVALDLVDRSGQAHRLLFRGLEHMKSQSLGTAATDSGQHREMNVFFRKGTSVRAPRTTALYLTDICTQAGQAHG